MFNSLAIISTPMLTILCLAYPVVLLLIGPVNEVVLGLWRLLVS
jgi:hypothetical protein